MQQSSSVALPASTTIATTIESKNVKESLVLDGGGQSGKIQK
jgi:hypothetical protein